jgi:hypothetical protein
MPSLLAALPVAPKCCSQITPARSWRHGDRGAASSSSHVGPLHIACGPAKSLSDCSPPVKPVDPLNPSTGDALIGVTNVPSTPDTRVAVLPALLGLIVVRDRDQRSDDSYGTAQQVRESPRALERDAFH